jgi:hypothetical protein
MNQIQAILSRCRIKKKYDGEGGGQRRNGMGRWGCLTILLTISLLYTLKSCAAECPDLGLPRASEKGPIEGCGDNGWLGLSIRLVCNLDTDEDCRCCEKYEVGNSKYGKQTHHKSKLKRVQIQIRKKKRFSEWANLKGLRLGDDIRSLYQIQAMC